MAHNQSFMCKLRLAMISTNPGQHPPLPLPLLVSVDPYTMQHLLELQALPCCGGFYMMPYDAGPVYQGMPAASGSEQNGYQYQPPSSAGPSRNQRKRFRKAEVPYHAINQFKHQSSGTVAKDRSTGVDTGHAWIGTNEDAGMGKVWITPTKNPLIVDQDLT